MNISAIAIKRPVFTVMVTVALIVLGVVGLSRLGTDLFPDVSFPIVSVNIVYPGASPAEVENLVSKPLEDAVVVGVPDERWGQRVAAVVSLRPGAEATLALVDAHCRAHLAGYKVPRQLHVVTALVRQPSGKPDYRWAREIAVASL